MILGSLVRVLRLAATSKWLWFGLAFGVAVYTVYNKGYDSARFHCQEQRIAEMQAVQEYYDDIVEENQKLNDEIIAQLKESKEKTRYEVREVIKYVQKNPDIDECGLDAEGLRIFNGTN